MDEALTAVKAIGSEWSRTPVLENLAERLPSELMDEALAAARAI